MSVSDAVTAPAAKSLADDERRVLRTLLTMQRQSWEQGLASHAALDLGRHDLARVFARDAVLRQTAAGKLAEIDDTGLVNCAANGEVVHWLAVTDDDPALADAFARQLDWIRHACPRAADGTLFHLAGFHEVWSDTVYMVVPFLVVADAEDVALDQLRGHQRRLWNPATGLYAARWSEDSNSLTLARAWGTGNGWVAAGLARALRLQRRKTPTPAGADLATVAAGHARTVIDACLGHRRPDGLFHDVIDDPSTFVEANLAQMLSYAVCLGVADGWLPTRYANTGRSLLASARRGLDADGFVTGVCGTPRFDRPGTSAEAQAFFLLAAAAVRSLDSADRADQDDIGS